MSHEPLLVPGGGGMKAGGSMAAQQKLNSQLDDLLGGVEDWDDEEEEEVVAGVKEERGDSLAQPVATSRREVPLAAREQAHPTALRPSTLTNRSPVDRPPGKPLKSTAKAEQKTAESDDELFDLLMDENESGYAVKPKPKFRMRSSSTQKRPSLSSEAGPRTTSEPAPDDLGVTRTLSGEAEGRPKSRKESVLERKQFNAILPSPFKLSGSSEHVQTLGESLERGSMKAAVGSGAAVKREGRVRKEREDDLLSGMELDDGEGDEKPKPFKVNTKDQPPSVPESLADQTENKVGSGESKEMARKSGKPLDEDSHIMFGGYTPSVMSGHGRAGLPITRGTRPSERKSEPKRPVFSRSERGATTVPVVHQQQHGHSEEDIVEERQRAVVREDKPARKSVRFAETLESSTLESPESEAERESVTNQQKFMEDDHDTLSNTKMAAKGLLQSKKEGPTLGEGGGKFQQSDSEPLLEHPVFPWQMKQRKRDLGGHTSGSPLHTDPRSQKHVNVSSESAQGSKGRRDDHIPASDDVSLPRPVRQEGSREDEKVLEQSGVKLHSKNHLQQSESDASLRKQIDDLKARVKSLEHELEGSEKERRTLAERLKTVEGEKKEVVGGLQSKEVELTSQLEEMRAKVQRFDCEKEQLKQSLETLKAHHTEEQTFMEKSQSARIEALEESFKRREEKWKEELKVETSHQRERLEQLEREKTDSLLALRKKMEAQEVAKTNEIAQLQETHRSIVADLKREHELKLNHVKDMHRQEIEALKAAHSHTQRLSELSNLVEETTRGVSELQSKVDQAHRQGLEDSQKSYQTHQRHLKTLEERLSQQYRDTESERGLLQSLAGRLEAHLAQQTQALEEERWAVQQERAKLRAGERALEEERKSYLTRLDQERRDLVQTKEKFLAEQQKLLSECYSERHSLASERAQLEVEQNRITETEKRDAQRRQAMESELEAAIAKATEQRMQLAAQTATLQQKEAQLKAESLHVEQETKAIERGRTSLLEQRRYVDSRREEADQLNQSAVALQREGKEMIEAAQRAQSSLAEQLEEITKERHKLEQREAQLASERLSFAREYRELQESQHPLSESLYRDPNPVLASTQRFSHSLLSPPPLNVSALTQSLPQPLSCAHSPQSQQLHPRDGRPSIFLPDQQDRRKGAWDTKQDELDLQKEREFLESIKDYNTL